MHKGQQVSLTVHPRKFSQDLGEYTNSSSDSVMGKSRSSLHCPMATEPPITTTGRTEERTAQGHHLKEEDIGSMVEDEKGQE